ncbi:hypothetical protein BH11CYA1_BH11CYA1_40430 [soil metagenome]
MSKIGLLFICSVISMITSSGALALALDTGSSGTIPKQNSGGGSGSSGGGSSKGAPSTGYSSVYSAPESTKTSSNTSSSSSGSGLSISYSGPSGVIPGTLIPSTVTHLNVSNKTGSAITIGLQCQLPGPIVQDGCTTNITDMQILDVTPGVASSPQAFTTFSPSQGTYALTSMHQYEIVNTKTNPYSVPAAQQQNCLQGLIISFGQWNSCPSTPGNAPAFPIAYVPGPNIPNGSNAAEPTLNIPGTIGGVAVPGTGSTEVCDITCVNGANSILKLTITSPSSTSKAGSQALPWLYDASGSIGAGQSFSTTNSWVNVAGMCDDNCYMLVSGNKVDRPGVFPYGCTQCNINPDPSPPCGQFCAAQNGLPANTGCTFNRAAQTANPVTAQFGGTVNFSYLSTAVPPATCASLGQP